MELNDVIELIDGKLLTDGVKTNKSIECVVACDLLSWVVGNACEGCGFITIQTSINVVAVASLIDMACVIVAENASVEKTVLLRAEEEDIPVIGTGLTTFEVCGKLYSHGIKAVGKNEAVC